VSISPTHIPLYNSANLFGLNNTSGPSCPDFPAGNAVDVSVDVGRAIAGTPLPDRDNYFEYQRTQGAVRGLSVAGDLSVETATAGNFGVLVDLQNISYDGTSDSGSSAQQVIDQRFNAEGAAYWESYPRFASVTLDYRYSAAHPQYPTLVNPYAIGNSLGAEARVGADAFAGVGGYFDGGAIAYDYIEGAEAYGGAGGGGLPPENPRSTNGYHLQFQGGFPLVIGSAFSLFSKLRYIPQKVVEQGENSFSAFGDEATAANGTNSELYTQDYWVHTIQVGLVAAMRRHEAGLEFICQSQTAVEHDHADWMLAATYEPADPRARWKIPSARFYLGQRYPNNEPYWTQGVILQTRDLLPFSITGTNVTPHAGLDISSFFRREYGINSWYLGLVFSAGGAGRTLL